MLDGWIRWCLSPDQPVIVKGDFDGDGDVDSKDLSGFASGFGRTDCLIP